MCVFILHKVCTEDLAYLKSSSKPQTHLHMYLRFSCISNSETKALVPNIHTYLNVIDAIHTSVIPRTLLPGPYLSGLSEMYCTVIKSVRDFGRWFYYAMVMKYFGCEATWVRISLVTNQFGYEVS